MSSKNLLDTKSAAEHLGLTKSTLETWRTNKCGPKYIKLGSAVRYKIEDLNQFINQNTVAPKEGGTVL